MLSKGFFARVTEDAFRGWIPIGDAKVEIPLDDSERRVLDVNTELLLRLPDFFFRTLLGSNVAANAQETDHLAAWISKRPLGGGVEARHSRSGAKLVVGLRFARLQDLAVALHDGLADCRRE